jgi:hypothetical protein
MSIKDAGAFVNDLVRGRGLGNVRPSITNLNSKKVIANSNPKTPVGRRGGALTPLSNTVPSASVSSVKYASVLPSAICSYSTARFLKKEV